jgi:hypothetical protein
VSAPSDFDLLQTAMGAYFEGLYQADRAILAPLFHEDARYVNATLGDYMNYSKEEYLQIVSTRTAPAQQEDVRNDRILSIEVTHGRMAFVRAQMQMMQRQYEDFLTFQKTDDRWQIQAKVFTYQSL